MADEQKKRSPSGMTPDGDGLASAPVKRMKRYHLCRQAPKAPAWYGFSGTYTHGVDAKGRMIIPASFREHLGGMFAVAPSLDFKAVAVYPLKAWAEQRDELLSLCERDARLRPVLEQFSKYSYTDSEVDAQGRLLLPQKLRSWLLKDVREVEVNGAVTYIRIIDSAVGLKQDQDFLSEHPDVLSLISQAQNKNH